MRKREMERLVNKLFDRYDRLQSDLFDHSYDIARHRNEDKRLKELEASVQRLTRRVLDLQEKLLKHDQAVLVQDPHSPQGSRVLTMLDVYRGKDPQGNAIHTVPDFTKDAWTYVIVDPRLVQLGEEARKA